MSTENDTTAETPIAFETEKKYELKYPLEIGKKKITEIIIEVPNGRQMLALTSKDTELEMLAVLVSQCCKNVRLTEDQVLDIKFPDLKQLIEVCSDFLL